MPGWRHPGDAASPAEILAGLHAEIAAKSPDCARLVARYEQVRASRPVPLPPGARGGAWHRLARLERIAEYARHRDAGLDGPQASARVGVHPRTGEKYEAVYRRGDAGP